MIPVLLALTSAMVPAFAQQPSGTPAPTPSPAAAPAAPAPAAPPAAAAKPAPAAPRPAPAGKVGEIRRDPAGQTGISPYTEQIVKGQASFVARDIPGAVTAFQDAIKLDPSLMLGFYRLGEAMLESGKPEEADTAWNTALGKKGSAELHAKVLFCLADLRERQKNWQGAKDAWTAYTTFVSSNPKATGFLETATERQKRIDQHLKDEQDYAPVRERIKTREEERLKEAEENAKKDTKNR
ncbi:Circumsporozoite protein [Chondromyces apiculatus DSM 436]|uniref:Circumsporozoite protein n=1 Tax=Chondromyces apiculatus DSM 436 TaxID=1192034 RepID=A0A017SUC5_9BACT|nr:Circumsporozoite protein [Chondromyces apiculatus DSM 436]